MNRQTELESPVTRLPDRAERRRIATRARLLAAARTVFARQGLAEATIAQIAVEADLGFGTFYLYFATKEDAYRAVVTEGFAELSERLAATRDQAIRSGAPWWDMVRLSVATYYTFAAENRELFLAMCAGGDIGAGLGRELQEQFAEQVAATLPASRAPSGTDSDSGHPTGQYRYEPALIARALVAALNSAVLWWIGAEDSDTGDSGAANDRRRLSLEALSDAMGRFVAAGLYGRVPGDE